MLVRRTFLPEFDEGAKKIWDVPQLLAAAATVAEVELHGADPGDWEATAAALGAAGLGDRLEMR